MATASQKMMLMRFLEVMRGSLMAAPTRLDPVRKMPLQRNGAGVRDDRASQGGLCGRADMAQHVPCHCWPQPQPQDAVTPAHQAAPMTDRPTHIATPRADQK